MIVEIVILAMIAAFLGMRLYSVLGRRAEHEEEIIPTNRFERGEEESTPRAVTQPAGESAQGDRAMAGFPPAIEMGLREISTADRNFELLGFLEGARGAYEVVLEAFWRGDKDELKSLCDDDVYESFEGVIDERNEAGITMDNRLIVGHIRVIFR